MAVIGTAALLSPDTVPVGAPPGAQACTDPSAMSTKLVLALLASMTGVGDP